MVIRQYRKKLDRYLSDYRHTVHKCREEGEALQKAESQIEHLNQAIIIVQQVAEKIQNTACNQIAAVVTKCIQTIFDDSYVFKISFVRKRGKTEAKLLLLKDGHVMEDPLEESGGGVCDVAAFGLRLACLMLSRPRLRKLFAGDEIMKNVNGEEHQSKVGALLSMLAKEMEMQFILVSDDEWLRIGKVIDLEGET